MKIKKETFILNSGTSRVYLIIGEDEKKYIKKVLHRKPKEKYERETRALKSLENYNHYPKIIEEIPKDYTFYMSHCGDQINKKNLPKDWLNQISEIRGELNKHDIVNGDINENHLLVLNGIIKIIDFGNIRFKSDIYFKENDYNEYERFQHRKMRIICNYVKEGKSSWNELRKRFK